MSKSEIKMPLPKLDGLFTTQEERDDEKLEKVVDIKLSNIKDFPNHPFKVINNANKNDLCLDLGCGEGRDAINLLNKGYNVDAVDYSEEAITSCKNRISDKYKDNFFQLDIFNNNLDKKYDYIYSVCVLHMFIMQEHRDKYYEFISNHLNDNGKCLIIVLGNDELEKETDIKEAFELEERIIANSNIKVNIPKTSCKILKRKDLNKEIEDNNFIIEKQWISNNVPGFNTTICTIIKQK